MNIIPNFQFRVLTKDSRCIFSRDSLSPLHFVTLIADFYCPEPQLYFFAKKVLSESQLSCNRQYQNDPFLIKTEYEVKK